MITELEFKSLALQGFNRIPLIAEAFADLETPLSLYLKLAHARDGGTHGRRAILGRDHQDTPAARCTERLAAGRPGAQSRGDHSIYEWRRDRRIQRPLKTPVGPHQAAEQVEVTG